MWAREGAALGAGEILLTSVDLEGTQKGLDVELCRAVTSELDIPVILSGGMGNTAHLVDAANRGHADAVAMAHVLHYGKLGFEQIRAAARDTGRYVREI